MISTYINKTLGSPLAEIFYVSISVILVILFVRYMTNMAIKMNDL